MFNVSFFDLKAIWGSRKVNGLIFNKKRGPKSVQKSASQLGQKRLFSGKSAFFGF